jgi:hypothetical protein
VGRNKKAVNCPGTCQDLVQFWKRRVGPTVLIKLPCRETEPSLGAIEAEHLAVLTLCIDRDPRNAKKIGKCVRAKHVVLADDLCNAATAALSCGGQGCLEFIIRLASLFNRERAFSILWVFLNNRNCLRSGARIHDDAETHLMASLLAQLHRLGIVIEQRFFEVGLPWKLHR